MCGWRARPRPNPHSTRTEGIQHRKTFCIYEGDVNGCATRRQMPLNAPPSIRREAPVNHFAGADTRKARRSAISSGSPKREMPDSSRYFLMASSIVTWCAGAHFSINDCRRPVITATGETLFTCTPSLMPCSAKAFARAMIAALVAAAAANSGLGPMRQGPIAAQRTLWKPSTHPRLLS